MVHQNRNKRKHPLLNMEPWPETTLGSSTQRIRIYHQAKDEAARPGVLSNRH